MPHSLATRMSSSTSAGPPVTVGAAGRRSARRGLEEAHVLAAGRHPGCTGTTRSACMATSATCRPSRGVRADPYRPGRGRGPQSAGAPGRIGRWQGRRSPPRASTPGHTATGRPGSAARALRGRCGSPGHRRLAAPPSRTGSLNNINKYNDTDTATTLPATTTRSWPKSKRQSLHQTVKMRSGV